MAKFIGVHSTITRASAGVTQVSANQPSKVKKHLWYIWLCEDGNYTKQAINSACQVLGGFEPLSKVEYDNFYKSEGHILAIPAKNFDEQSSDYNFIISKEEAAEKARVEAEIREEEEEKAKQAAVHAKILEVKLREKFALEIAKVRRGQIEKTMPAIKYLLQTKEGITEDHVYMFTDFGIDLRKVKFYDLAKLSFERANELQNDDPNIWFNLARINFESREYELALKCINMTLKIEPEHEYGIKLYKAILKAQKSDNFWD